MPCDGEDDFCEDFADESCESSALAITASVAVLLLIITLCLTEVVYRYKRSKTIKAKAEELEMNELIVRSTFPEINAFTKKELKRIYNFFVKNHSSNKKVFIWRRELLSFCNKMQRTDLCKKISEAELKVHKQNMREMSVCIKENIGTNKTAEKIIKSSHGKPHSSNRLWQRKKYSSQKDGNDKLYWMLTKRIARAILTVTFYYLDLAKDFAVVYFSTKILVDSSDSFSSFGAQILTLLWISILLPFLINAAFLFAANPLKNLNSVTLRIVLALLSPTTPAFAISMNARFSFKKDVCLQKLRRVGPPRRAESDQVLIELKNVEKEIKRDPNYLDKHFLL